jgi:hypothetical protein
MANPVCKRYRDKKHGYLQRFRSFQLKLQNDDRQCFAGKVGGMVIEKNTVNGHATFCVSERLREKIEQENYKGLVFMDLNVKYP